MALERTSGALLLVSEPMLALAVEESSSNEIRQAFQILVERHTRYGGPLGSKVPISVSAGSTVRRDGHRIGAAQC